MPTYDELLRSSPDNSPMGVARRARADRMRQAGTTEEQIRTMGLGGPGGPILAPRPAVAVPALAPPDAPSLPAPVFSLAGPSGGTSTGSTPAAIAAASLLGRSQGAVPSRSVPTVPTVYNGPTREQPSGEQTGSPIEGIVARSLGGSNGRIPSAVDFIRSMPQSAQMQFGSGQGQIANGLGIGGPLTQGYTPAFQGPVQSPDHTQAALQAYQGLLGPLTHGPESPTQALSRANSSLAETIKNLAEYGGGAGGRPGLQQQRVDNQAQQFNRDMNERQLQMGGSWINEGHSRAEVQRRMDQLNQLRQGMQPGVHGATSAGAAPATAAPDIEELFRQTLVNSMGPQTGPTRGEPTFTALDPKQRNDALNRFILSAVSHPQIGQQLATPAGQNALRNLLIQRVGPDRYQDWVNFGSPLLHNDATRSAADTYQQLNRLTGNRFRSLNGS